MSTFLLLSALLPITYLIIAGGSVSRFFNKPGRLQVYSVLGFRWHLLGSSILLWLAGIVALTIETPSPSWLINVTGILLIVLIPIGVVISSCKMFSVIKEANFLTPSEIQTRLSPDDPVIGLEINGESHAYPIKWLEELQIVEDVVGGTPVVVTYSKHGEKAVVFSDEFKHNSLRLIFPPHREENVMLYDPRTKRLVQQMSGEIIFGPDKGGKIPTLPLRIVPWVTWESIHPESKVFYHERTEPTAPGLKILVNKAITYATSNIGLNIAATHFPAQHHTV